MDAFVIVQFSTTVYAQSNPSKSIKPDLLIRPNSLTATELVIYIVKVKVVLLLFLINFCSEMVEACKIDFTHLL